MKLEIDLKEPAVEDVRKQNQGDMSSLLSLAQFYKKRGNEKKYNIYMDAFFKRIKELDQNENILLSREILTALYHNENYEQLFCLEDRCKDNQELKELFFTLACSAYFKRGEPNKALLMAKQLKDPEQRRLRQKTAELWTDIFVPIPAKDQPRVHLLLLTYNRVKYVEQALRQLAATNYDNYAVYIADNGSTDGTLEIAMRAKEIFPAHVPVRVESFPTNIGRPAGHNWLLTGYDHSQAEFIAIGDDDLTKVPPCWLQNMIRTASAFPRCGCVGGKAVNGDNPVIVHGGVRNFTSFGSSGAQLTNGYDQEDVGQFDFIDIVDHVIGCLHIYKRSALDDVGIFDIRYSPCQFVDIDHHLQFRLAGYDIIFNGLISFEHLQAMGKAAQKDTALGGNSFANMLKMIYKYSDHNHVINTLAACHTQRDKWLGF